MNNWEKVTRDKLQVNVPLNDYRNIINQRFTKTVRRVRYICLFRRPLLIGCIYL